MSNERNNLGERQNCKNHSASQTVIGRIIQGEKKKLGAERIRKDGVRARD